ncbi:Hypothetical protein R9X50_00575600 [Acrodontium crateriforme]|uniref:Major facilitator superfamily (MFS) profile domain-containing protein n=1 Tax=Acrodontium crateriforme TaxID=150365 RepID=A0AAQ3M9Y2_9PEZI|nr:Hypothetical protein R9X50_00575600 [Acrodontium crateriforme]
MIASCRLGRTIVRKEPDREIRLLTMPKNLTPRDPNKFPAAQLFLLALVRVAEPIALTSIFPYAWRLVLHFKIGEECNASFYAGILISAFSLAESLTGMYWGGVSDRIGRKPVLLIGCFGTIASLLIVGLSSNFWIALLGRVVGGLLNGNIGVIQTMVGELVLNPKHEPKAYAIMPFVWSIGCVVGPAIGGYFATPAENFPNTPLDNVFFAKFPFALPNFICVGLMLISVIAGYICLDETHPDMQPWSTPRDLERTCAITPLMPTQASTTTSGANLAHDSYGTFNNVSEEAVEEEWNVKPDGTSRPPSIHSASSQKVFTKRVVQLTVALGLFTYHSMTYDHLLPIFLQDERTSSNTDMFNLVSSRHGALAGGLGLSIKQVGVIMSINGIIALFVQGIVFPIMASWLGIWRLFIAVTILHPFAYFIVPWLALLPQSLVYPGIYACLTIRNCLSILAYPVLLILIKEASPAPNCLGKINGLAASTGAACRTMASPIAGLLYGVGIESNFTALAYLASSFVAVIGALQVLTIKRDDSGPRHQVRAVASCRFRPSSVTDWDTERRRSSVVRIRVHTEDDNEYERPQFASRVP